MIWSTKYYRVFILILYRLLLRFWVLPQRRVSDYKNLQNTCREIFLMEKKVLEYYNRIYSYYPQNVPSDLVHQEKSLAQGSSEPRCPQTQHARGMWVRPTIALAHQPLRDRPYNHGGNLHVCGSVRLRLGLGNRGQKRTARTWIINEELRRRRRSNLHLPICLWTDTLNMLAGILSMLMDTLNMVVGALTMYEVSITLMYKSIHAESSYRNMIIKPQCYHQKQVQ